MNLVDGIDFAKLFAQIAAGGPVYWIVAGVLLLGGIGLFIWWKINQRKIAEKLTEQQKQKDQADTKKQNQKASSGWKEAEKKSKATRESVRASMKAKKK